MKRLALAALLVAALLGVAQATTTTTTSTTTTTTTTLPTFPAARAAWKKGRPGVFHVMDGQSCPIADGTGAPGHYCAAPLVLGFPFASGPGTSGAGWGKLPVLYVACDGACTVMVACQMPGDPALDLAASTPALCAMVTLTGAGTGMTAFTWTCPFMAPVVGQCTGSCNARAWVGEDGAEL